VTTARTRRLRAAGACGALAGALAAALLAAGCGRSALPAVPVGGPWHVAYDGYGRVSTASGDRGAITLTTARPATPGSTHAALVLSARTWRGFRLDLRLRTNGQLRRDRPNDWEVGWIVWHYLGNDHFYYLMLRPDGWELGQENPAYPGEQRFLTTGTRPAFPLHRWYQVVVSQRGDVITASVDGRRLVRFADTARPYLSGRIGLYAEDASASYQPVSLAPLR